MDSKITIKGITKDGSKFRPSDWSDRLVGLGQNGCTLRICNGIKCIDVYVGSEQSERILQFARDNDLQIEEL